MSSTERHGSNGDTADLQDRWRDSLAHAAESAYRRASADEIPTEARSMRWRLDRRTGVSVAFLLAVVALIGGALLVGGGQADPAVDAGPSIEPSVVQEDPVAVVVHVAGEVAEPGLVELAAGERVGTAIDRAGGALPDADLSAVNLARVPQDGEQIRVPAIGEAALDGGGLISLSTADADELEQLPGIGPVLAERIVADREANGPFSSVDDLTRVSGIGESLVGGLDGLASP